MILQFIRIWGNDSNGTYQQCAEILAEADGDHGTGDKPTALSFKVSADNSVTPVERLRIDSAGRLLLGSGAVSLPKGSGTGSFDLDNGSITMCIGGNVNSTGRTNSTDKINRISSPHYTNAEEPVMIMSAHNTSSSNTINYGGGSSLCNNATVHVFFTAANTTTTGGTERLRITSDGRLNFSGQTSSTGTASISHHTNNNLYIRGGTSGLVLGNHDGTNIIHISNSNHISFETTDGTERLNTV